MFLNVSEEEDEGDVREMEDQEPPRPPIVSTMKETIAIVTVAMETGGA